MGWFGGVIVSQYHNVTQKPSAVIQSLLRAVTLGCEHCEAALNSGSPCTEDPGLCVSVMLAYSFVSVRTGIHMHTCMMRAVGRAMTRVVGRAMAHVRRSEGNMIDSVLTLELRFLLPDLRASAFALSCLALLLGEAFGLQQWELNPGLVRVVC